MTTLGCARNMFHLRGCHTRFSCAARARILAAQKQLNSTGKVELLRRKAIMSRNSNSLSSVTSVGVRTVGCAFAVIIMTLLLTVPLEATKANYRLCFTQVVGLPITNPNQPPTIDGVVAGDPGWTQAFRYVWANGAGLAPNAALHGIRDNTYLYLSIEVNNDTSLNQNNLIVLALSPSD